MYHQVFDPVGASLGLSALVAALPLLTIFVLLGMLRMKAQWAALIAVAVAVLVAVTVYSMPVGQALSATAEGAAFGLFPIMWIVVNAIWIYMMTVRTGHFDVLRRSFGTVSTDQRVQAVIIAFCFGALLEALAGFGTPVAITSVMLIALGFRPMKAASVALVANTAPVAFGAIAVPITTLARITALPVHDLGATVGRQTPVLALFVPLALVFMVDGRRGLRQTWPAAVLGGLAFALAQFAASNYLSIELTDIVAALVSAIVIVLLLRAWQPAPVRPVDPLAPLDAEGSTGRADVAAALGAEGAARSGTLTASRGRHASPGGGSDGADGSGGPARPAGAHAAGTRPDHRARVLAAYSPYLIIVAVFSVAQIHWVTTQLARGTRTFAWPGLHIVSPSGKAPSAVTFTVNYLPAAGTLLLVSGALTAIALRLAPGGATRCYAQAVHRLRWAIVTVAAVLALAYVMNLSGQTITIGQWIAGTGALLPLLSPVLGWLGVAVTGSDTSSNALFGTLQVAAAKQAHLNPVLLAAANSSGGVLGKMISPQNLAIAAAATGLAGREGDLFRRVLGWSLALLLVMCLLVWLQSTSALSWMLP